ncbi:MAG TPA: response regulator transcription factor [Spirochaetota bacterium]|nr:response regulator transcription factor [Spirochaetota bacterium]HPJ44251.1 response regulator transcription factor [Spirochaetota bacterium]
MDKIIIVDDHPVVINGLRSIFMVQGGYSVTGEATNADDAINLLCEELPDILLVDIELGCGINGIELVRRVREAFPCVKILVMSLDDGSLYAERAIRAGARGFISKVDLMDSIFTALETIKQGEIYLSSEICSIIACNHFRDYIKPLNGRDVVGLTDRELEVFQLIGRGYKRDEIAEKLNISVSTLEVHRRKIRIKMNIPDASALTKAAIQHEAERFNIEP